MINRQDSQAKRVLRRVLGADPATRRDVDERRERVRGAGERKASRGAWFFFLWTACDAVLGKHWQLILESSGLNYRGIDESESERRTNEIKRKERKKMTRPKHRKSKLKGREALVPNLHGQHRAGQNIASPRREA